MVSIPYPDTYSMDISELHFIFKGDKAERSGTISGMSRQKMEVNFNSMSQHYLTTVIS
jgi:hypothetical protein